MTLPRTVLQCSWLQRELFWLQKLWNEILKKKWKLSSYCCSTDATFINLTLQQTSTEHKNKNILWWTCVHTEDITIKCIFISDRHLEFEPSGSAQSLPIPQTSTIKMASLVKKPCFALNGQRNLWGCLHKRKKDVL